MLQEYTRKLLLESLLSWAPGSSRPRRLSVCMPRCSLVSASWNCSFPKILVSSKPEKQLHCVWWKPNKLGGKKRIQRKLATGHLGSVRALGLVPNPVPLFLSNTPKLRINRTYPAWNITFSLNCFEGVSETLALWLFDYMLIYLRRNDRDNLPATTSLAQKTATSQVEPRWSQGL